MSNHYKRIWLICILMMLALIWSTQALGEARGGAYYAYYDEGAGKIKYGVSGGEAGTYIVEVNATGCVTVDSPNDLIGPADDDAADVHCVQASSVGEAVVTITDPDGKVVARYKFKFNCDSECNVTATSQLIPTLTEWGLIIFGVLLIGLMVFYIVKRRKALPIAA